MPKVDQCYSWFYALSHCQPEKKEKMEDVMNLILAEAECRFQILNERPPNRNELIDIRNDIGKVMLRANKLE